MKRLSTSSDRSQTSKRSSRSSLSSVTSAWETDEVLPQLDDREEWFFFWDQPEHGGAGTGLLTEKQVVRALGRTFPHFEKKIIETIIKEVWVEFDESKEGALGFEIMKPQFGLVDTAHMLLLWSR